MSLRPFVFLMLAALLCAGNPAQAQMSAYNPVDQQTPSAPTGVKVFIKNRILTIQWNNVKAAAVTEYHLFRYEGSNPQATLVTLAVIPRNSTTPAVVSYYDTSALASHAYAYFVTCKDRFGASSPNSKTDGLVTPADFGMGVPTTPR